eukprot:gene31300-6448_t
MTDRLRRSSRKRPNAAASSYATGVAPDMPPPTPTSGIQKSPTNAPKGSSRLSLPQQEGGDERTNASYEGSTLAQQEITSASSPAQFRNAAELSFIKPSRGRLGLDDPAISAVCGHGAEGLKPAELRDAQEFSLQPQPAESAIILEGLGAGAPEASRVDIVQGVNTHENHGSGGEATQGANGGMPLVGACSSAPTVPAVMSCEEDLRAAIEHLTAVEPSEFMHSVLPCSGLWLGSALICCLLPVPAVMLCKEDLRAAIEHLAAASYIHGLAAAFSSGLLTDAVLSAKSEEEMQTCLTQLKGIGPWTVHMYQMFVGGRPDCLPTGDLSIRKALQLFFDLPSPPTPSQMEALTQNWRPYRSVACYYMWSMENGGGASSLPPSASAQVLVADISMQGRSDDLSPPLATAPSGGALYRPNSAADVACSESSGGCSNVAVEQRGGPSLEAVARQASATSAMGIMVRPASTSSYRGQDEIGRQVEDHVNAAPEETGMKLEEERAQPGDLPQQPICSSNHNLGECRTMGAVSRLPEGSVTLAAGDFVMDTGTIVAGVNAGSSGKLSVEEHTEWAGQHQSGEVAGAKRRRCALPGGDSRQDSGGASTRPHIAPC